MNETPYRSETPRHDEWRSVEHLPAGEREGAWQEILSDTLLPMSVRLPGSPAGGFRGRVRRQWLDDVALVECFSDPFTGCRTTAHAAADGDEFVAVLIDVSGYEFVAQRDNVVRVRPGGGVTLSSGANMRFEVAAPYRKRCLVVPVRALRQVAGAVPTHECVELLPDSPAVALLDGYLGTLARTLPSMSGHERGAARNAALHLVAAALHRSGDDSATGMDSLTATPALRASMDSWIDRHLLDQHLSPTALAAAHTVSVRTVHRLFGRDGATFSSVVRTRRLDRARQELADGDRSVSAIAATWGFADASHFSRSFKEAFGVSPREFRARCSALHPAARSRECT